MEGVQTALFETIVSAMVGALLGAFVGGFITYLVGLNQRRKDAAKTKRHSAAMLYWDLYSIERYTQSDYSSTRPGIRYSKDWQMLMAPCRFLSEVQVSLIYQVYDMVYDFNFFYAQKFSSELEGAQHTFHTLKVVFNSKEWNTIVTLLKEQMGQK